MMECTGRAALSLLSLVTLVSLIAGPAVADEQAGAERERVGQQRQAVAPGREKPQREVVFRSTREEADDGSVVWSEVYGDLDAEAAQRVGRPWSWFHTDQIYHEEAWSQSLPGGATTHGYRVTRTPNANPILPESTFGPPEVGAELARALHTAAPAALLPLTVEVRNFPEWDIPLRTASFSLGAADLAKAAATRQRAVEKRQTRAEGLFEPVERAIRGLGGQVVGRGKMGGWITARVPAVAIPTLLARDDLKRVNLLRGDLVEHGGLWDMATVRSDSYIDARQFIAEGFNGEQSNFARHDYGDITVGVIEIGQLENQACFLYDGSECSGATRLQELFRCDDFDRDGNYCEPVSFFRDNDDSASHGTLVASTVLADYTEGQGDAHALGDSSWTAAAGHDAGWESRNSGIAQEARLIFFGQMADNDPEDGTVTSNGLADAFDDAIDRAVDITNSSWGFNTGSSSSCSMTAVAPHELEAENAFDDGILNVVSAGNPNTPVCLGDRSTTCDENSDCAAGTGPCVTSNTGCNIGSPADLPKTFAVNALNGNESACMSAYSNCTVDPDFSANGGITAMSNGATCTGCVSGIDIAAPNRICGPTSASGLHGSAGSCFNGTSAAAPVVAGAAALVKSQYLDGGNAFINSPGRLHTIMLAMGDRSNMTWGQTSTTQLTSTASDLMGTGKLKMRLLRNGVGMDPWGNSVTTWSFVSGSSGVTYVPWPTPIPVGAAIVKCVSFQIEDMSSKSEISRVDLEMRLRQPVSGGCFDDPLGSGTATRIDAGVEIKHMGVFVDSATNIENRCLHVTLDTEFVTNAGVTVVTQCYYAGVEDEFSAPGS